jgi:Ca2+-binding EF-hand superfamily protein
MASLEVRQNLAALFYQYYEAERKTEVCRQVLQERPDFDPFSAYRRITSEVFGGISHTELKAFFNDNDSYPETYSLDLLFVRLDYDQDNVISWPEFLTTVISRENHYLYANQSNAPYSFEVDYALLRCLDQEMDNEKAIEGARAQLWHCEAFNAETLFKLLDRENKGWLSLQDVHKVLNEFYPEIDWSGTERAFRRLDEDADRKISMKEFLRTMRPIYCYRAYEHYVPQLREVSPAKLYYKAKEPRPMASLKKDLTKSQVASLSSKAQKDRSEVILETQVMESPSHPIDRPLSVYQKWNYGQQDMYRTRSMYNDNHWVLDHPAYWSSGPWWNYPIAHEQQHWLDHPYNAHRRLLENQKNNEIEIPEAPTKNPLAQTLPQRNNEMSPSKKRVRACPEHTYSPEKREVHKFDELLATKAGRPKNLPSSNENSVNTPPPVIVDRETDPVECDIVKYVLQPGEITDENKRALVENIKECLTDQKTLEEKRINLSLRFDFCVGEFFQQCDGRKTGYVNLQDLWTYSKFSSFQMNKEDWCIVMDRYDRDRDAHLSLIEFSD